MDRVSFTVMGKLLLAVSTPDPMQLQVYVPIVHNQVDGLKPESVVNIAVRGPAADDSACTIHRRLATERRPVIPRQMIFVGLVRIPQRACLTAIPIASVRFERFNLRIDVPLARVPVLDVLRDARHHQVYQVRGPSSNH